MDEKRPVRNPAEQRAGVKDEGSRRDAQAFPKHREASEFGTHGGSRKGVPSKPLIGEPSE